MVRRHPLALASAVVIIALGWLFSATLFSSKVLGGETNLMVQLGFDRPADMGPLVNELTYDSIYVFHPDMLEARRALRSGHLPSWTPYIGAGEPLLATQQNATLFPLNWPAFVLPFWQSLEWLALLKLFFAALGTLLLLGALRLRAPAALFGAVAFGLSLWMVDWVDHPHVNAYLMIPWALWAAERLARRRGLGDAAVLALVGGLALLGGQPEAAFFLALITVPYFLARRPPPRTLALGGAALAVALMLGAVMLLPFAQIAAHATELARGGNAGAPRNVVLSFFMPELWGRPDKYELAGAWANYFERTAYFGALPLVLAVGGLVARRPRGPQLFFAIFGLLALGMAVQVPVYTHAVAHLPVFDHVNLQRALVLVALCGAVLGAYGLDALLGGDRRVRLRLLGGAGAVALIPVVWLAGHRDLLHQFGAAWDQLPVMGRTQTFRAALQMGVALRWCLLALAALALIALVSWRPRFALAAALVAVALTTMDLVTLGRGYNPATPLAYADPPTPTVVSYLRAHLGHARFAGSSADLGPNVAERFQLRDPRVHEQPVVERRRRLWEATGGEGYLQRIWLGAGSGRAADLFAVRYAFMVPFAQAGPPPDWKPTPQPYLFERAHPRPRAFVAYDWTPARGMDDALQIVKTRSDGGDLRAPVIEGARAAPAAADAAEPTSATFVRDGTRRVTLEANAKRPGWLVLADTYFPGWTAKLDGREVPIRAANVAFRAVRVPAGRHTVDFEYSPAPLRFGIVLSLAALVLIALAISAGGRSRIARDPDTGR